MRKTALYWCLALAVTGTVALVGKVDCGTDQVLDPHDAYVQLFNEKLAALPKWHEGEESERYNQPDMFAAFDKLKRMDPRTGEVPADGLTRAYAYFLDEWGYPAMNPESGSNYGLNWDHRGPTGIGGRTRGILWDPNSSNNKGFFAGGVGGGLWHTDDVTASTPSWTQVSPIFSNVAVTCINVDPSNTQVLYFGTGEGWFNADAIRGAGVWKSMDGGSTWAQLASTNNNSYYYCQGIEVTSDGTLYVATKGGLFRSDDGGTTMTKVLGTSAGATNDWMTDIEQGGNGDLFVGVSGSGVYKSAASLGTAQGTNGNWTRLTGTNFVSGFSRVELAVGENNPAYVYALCEVSNATSPVYRSTNGGTTWSATSGQPNFSTDFSNGQAWYDLCIQVDPFDANVAWVGGIDIHRTTNGGGNWSQITSGYGIPGLPYMHPDQHYIMPNPVTANEVVFSNDGGIYYSANRGTSVSEHNNNYNVTQYYSIAIDPTAGSNKMIGGAQDNGSSMVDAPGVGVGISLTGSDGAYVAINALDPDTMYTTTQYATVRRSRNNGSTFASITNTALNDNNTLFINPLEIDPVNPVNLYQASTQLWHHPNAAAGSASGWTRRTADLSTNITAIAPGYNPSTTVYFAAGGRVYRIANISTANSTTVPPTVNPSGLGSGYINCVSVNPNDNNHIIVTYSSFGVAQRVAECRNADQGANATWKNLAGNLPDIPCNWAVFEPNNPNGILVGTDMGVFRCTDISLPANQIYWTPESMGLGLPRVDMMKVRYSDKMVFAGTHGRGFFSTNSYNLPPAANFAALNTNACNGYVQFSDSTANAPTGWNWDFGDGGSSLAQNPLHQYASSGTYNVVLISSNPNGADTTTQSLTVTVLSPPTAVASADTSGCPGDTVTLSASGGVSYSWSPPGGLINPTSATPSFVISQSRTFVVTVTDANGCTDTDTVIVTANPAPSVWAGADQTITAPGGSVQLGAQGAATYSWTPSTGLSCTNCPNPVANPTVTTTYTCTGYSALGCPRSDNVTVFVNIVGVDPSLQGGFGIDAVAPQPMAERGTIHLRLPESQNVRLDLVDLSGKIVGVVYEGMMPAGPTKLAWDRGGLASGVYFLRMRADGHSAVKRVVLQ